MKKIQILAYMLNPFFFSQNIKKYLLNIFYIVPPLGIKGLILPLMLLIIFYQKNQAQDFDAENLGILQINIENTEGEIKITGTDTKKISLPKNISAEINGEIINIKNQSSKQFLIEIPKNCNIKIQNHKGNVFIKNFDGKVETDIQEGNISLEQISQEVYANTNKGNIIGLFKEVFPKKMLSIINVEGNISLALPKNIDVNWVIKSDNAIGKGITTIDKMSPINPERPTFMIYNKKGKVDFQ